MRKPEVNITPIERIGRVAVGIAAAVAGVLLLVGAGSTLAIVLETLLALAGLDLMLTGALGLCPLYRRLGYVPSSLRSQPRRGADSGRSDEWRAVLTAATPFTGGWSAPVASR